MRRYAREDFDEVMLVPGKFYCPWCNRSWDDYDIPSIGCPCDTHAEGRGSLTAAQVESYLGENN